MVPNKGFYLLILPGVLGMVRPEVLTTLPHNPKPFQNSTINRVPGEIVGQQELRPERVPHVTTGGLGFRAFLPP